MWRIQGFVGRVLSRCYGNTPLRVSSSHHVEDEVISSSTVLSTGRQISDSSSQRRENGENNKEQQRKASQFCHDRLQRYTALDAVGWGVAAVLFTQLCRGIHSQFSSLSEPCAAPGPRREPNHIPTCTYRVLLDILSRHDALPGEVNVMCLKGAPTSTEQGHLIGSSVNDYIASTSSEHPGAPLPGHTTSQQQGETIHHNPAEMLVPDVQIPGPVTAGCDHPQEKSPCCLDQAVQNLKTAADSSVPVILNIIGLESAKVGDYTVAFECFMTSAQQHYSKAQFNVGVCYERGRGVHKDAHKALQYYRHAAEAGHTQAQYRCAKLLLDSRGQQSASDADISTALSLLHKAAAAGLTKAQLYLGVLLSQSAYADAKKSVQYFRMAAESGDSHGLLYLAQCYERGFGLGQCYSTAVSLYQQAAAKGNQQAKSALRDLHSKEVLRSIRSAPCLSVVDRLHLSSVFPRVLPEYQPVWSPQPLLHSYSTGNLALPPFPAETLSSHSTRSGWIIGVG